MLSLLYGMVVVLKSLCLTNYITFLNPNKMKTTTKFLALLLLTFSLFTACSKDEEVNSGPDYVGYGPIQILFLVSHV